MARPKDTSRGLSVMAGPLVGCWHPVSDPEDPSRIRRVYLPMSTLRVHTVVKDVASRTTITQSFSNTTDEHLERMVYSFPAFSGISIISFAATVGDVRVTGMVKEKGQARREFEQAVAQNKAAALMEQLPQASDVFTTHIGNVPARSTVVVELTYVTELTNDAETDGLRVTIPSKIAPRFGGPYPNVLMSSSDGTVLDDLEIIVDVESSEGCPVQDIQSPSHAITVNLGRTTTMAQEASLPNRASATLSVRRETLDKDFIAIVNISNGGTPKALLETHAAIPKQRALMVTLVPKLDVSSKPSSEIVFVLDRSGSMGGKMHLVTQAMTTMLKSLRVGLRYNICSFGSQFSFLWPRSKPYNEETLTVALDHVGRLDSSYGGTSMLKPVQAVLSKRISDLPLNVILLTDGQIWNQHELFEVIRDASQKDGARFFSLGIGHGISTALVNGIATEGKGISQFVTNDEAMDTKMVRLLKCAMMPYMSDISLDVKYRRDDEEYDIIEAKEASKVTVTLPVRSKGKGPLSAVLSLFNKDSAEDMMDVDKTGGDEKDEDDKDGATIDRFAHLPTVSAPPVLQAPFRLPPLYPSSRTTVYLLLDPSTFFSTPESVILRASCDGVPIEFDIPVEDVGKGETIHALAAKEAVSELELGHGWLSGAVDREAGTLLRNKYRSEWDGMVEREAIRLSLRYQIAGKWCSYVAVEGSNDERIVRDIGRAPRKQLASKACRRSVPSTSIHQYAIRKPRPRQEKEAGGLRRSPRLQGTARGAPTSPSPGYEPNPDPEPDHGAHSAAPTTVAKPQTVTETVHALIRLQKFDGSWAWEESLLGLTGAIDHAGNGTGNGTGNVLLIRKDAAGATALVVAFLRTRAAHEMGSWELVAEKAVSWLDAQQDVDGEAEINRMCGMFASI